MGDCFVVQVFRILSMAAVVLLAAAGAACAQDDDVARGKALAGQSTGSGASASDDPGTSDGEASAARPPMAATG